MLRARCIVLPPKLLKIKSESPSTLSVDGQIFCSLEADDYITVEKSEYSARLVHSEDMSFYDILQKKHFTFSLLTITYNFVQSLFLVKSEE